MKDTFDRRRALVLIAVAAVAGILAGTMAV